MITGEKAKMASERLIPLALAALLCAQRTRADIRINCMPDVRPSEATEKECTHRSAAGCVWSPAEDGGTPQCIFNPVDPADKKHFAGYDVNSFTWSPSTGTVTGDLLRRVAVQSLFGDDHDRVRLHARQVDRATVQLQFMWKKPDVQMDEDEPDDRVEFEMGQNASFALAAGGDLQLELQGYPMFGFRILRADSLVPLFDARYLPGLIFSQHFVQISGLLASTPGYGPMNMYGLGQQFHTTIQRNFNFRRYSMLNLDQYPVKDMNLYGAQPFFIGTTPGNPSQFYGAFLQTDFPMDVFLQPDPQIISYRVAGGVGSISLYFYAGPTYDEVVEQHLRLVGRPQLPPFWALGFHLSRYGYNNTQGLKKVWRRNRLAKIPQDVQTIDIDYMNKQKDFTVGQSFHDLPSFLHNVIHATGRKLVPITDPAIASDPKLLGYEPLHLGKQLDIFVKDGKGKNPINTVVWPGKSYMPDFTHPNATDYWTQCIRNFRDTLPIDGMWIDMNEPATFVNGTTPPNKCEDNKLNNPPFSPVDYKPIYMKTLCMDAKHYGDRSHMEIHNRFGHYEAKASHLALAKLMPDRRPFVYTRANAPGTGVWAGNWMGDTVSDWESLAQSVVGMIEMNMFGIAMTGSDICGFNGDTTEELCLRWHQLGAFYPFSRNHNSDENRDQDPAVWHKPVVDAIRRALRLRYTMLPYLYSLLCRAHIRGTPVVRPMFALKGVDGRASYVSDQFMWGDALMFAPIVVKGSVHRSVWDNYRSVYFPPGVWYPLMNAMVDGVPHVKWVVSGEGGSVKNVATRWQDVPVFIRGGYTIFRQGHGETTLESARTPFKLEVAFDAAGQSAGDLYWDDGDDPKAPYDGKYCQLNARARLSATGGYVDVVALHRGCFWLPPVAQIRLHGMYPGVQLSNVRVDGAPAQNENDTPTAVYDADKLVHVVHLPNVQLTQKVTVSWSAERSGSESEV